MSLQQTGMQVQKVQDRRQGAATGENSQGTDLVLQKGLLWTHGPAGS